MDSLVALRDAEPGHGEGMFVLAIDPRLARACFEAIGARTALAGEVLVVRRD